MGSPLQRRIAAETARRLFTTHGATAGGEDTPTYRSWLKMRQRCFDSASLQYPYYGGRGITICARWSDFVSFLADMGERPEGRTLDRIEVNGNYEPGNCRWATRTEQARNRRDTVILEHDGLRLTISEWAERLGVKRKTLHWRLRHGWSVERVLSPEVRP